MKPVKHPLSLAVSLLASLTASELSQAQADEPSDSQIEEVFVYGQRAMMEGAIARQRESDRIMSVITRDAIGNFPDQNVAESVRRLSGVNVLNDQGEGRFIAVRGLDPGLNSSSVNGVRLPSPEAGTRAVALDVIASELVESIEVIKTLTPDMNADTIGASINIKTTRAFNLDEPFLSIKGEQSWNDLAEAWSPKAVVDFMYPVNDRFGIAGGLSWQEREFSTDNVEADGWSETDDGIVYADTVEYRDYDVIRERTSGSLSLDFQATDNTVLYARGIYSLFEDTESRRALVIGMDEEPSGTDGSSVLFSSADGEIAVEREQKDRYEAQIIQNYTFGGETRLANWDFDYFASYAYAEEHEKDTQDPTLFAASFEDPGALGIAWDYSNFDLPAYAIFEGADDFFNPATYEIDKIEVPDALSEDEEITLQFDAARRFQLDSGELEIKFGGNLRQRTKDFDLTLEVLEDFDGDYSVADVLGQPSYGLFNIAPMMSVGAVRAFNNANLDRFSINEFDSIAESNVGDFLVDEDISSAYLMGTWRSGALTVIGGLRIEDTENDVRANRTELLEEGSELNGEILEEDTVVVTATRDSNSYTNWLPSLSLRFDARDDIVMRAGFFSSVVRPNPEQLAPIFAVEESGGDREGTEAIVERLHGYLDDGKRVFTTSSFQSQSLPLLHMISRVDRDIPVYYTNTGFLFPADPALCRAARRAAGLRNIPCARRCPRSSRWTGRALSLRLGSGSLLLPQQGPAPGAGAARARRVGQRRARGPERRARAMAKRSRRSTAACATTRCSSWDSRMVFYYRKMHDLPEHPMEAHGLPEHRLRALHHESLRRGQCAQRPLVRHEQDRVRPEHHPGLPAAH
jgi:TonB-dependent receptor